MGGNGGGIYLISQTKPVLISNTVFERNKVFSIYNFAGQGGAMAMARLSLASLSNCMFLSNMAAPIPGTSASSGSAGAIFVQSAFVNILSCTFESNLATAGQFDAGAQGGALLFENVVQSVIADSVFSQNAASGYSTAPQYTSSGTGGAIGLHLAVVTISGCQFVRNWVSTGIFQAGTGGAISGAYFVHYFRIVFSLIVFLIYMFSL